MTTNNKARDTLSFNASSLMQNQLPFSTPRSISKRSHQFKPTTSSLGQNIVRVPSKSPLKQIIHLSNCSKSPITKRVIQVPVGTSYEIIETLNTRFLDYEKSIKQRLSKLQQRSRAIIKPKGDY